ncbi:class F sortase [Streptomyces specialis]|uniref:class F sortase n=1 Tax=Streptomyces specialis TaxID=498367 RepID=UPI00099E8395|nr:class F sortase [Streptomyces specialis]
MRLPEYIPDYDPYDEADGTPGWGTRAACAALAGLVILGVTVMFAGGDGGAPAPPQPDTARQEPAATAGTYPGTGVQPLPPAVPTWVSVPSIGVEAPLTNVGLDAEGWVQAPPQEIANLAGWYDGATPPGALGTSVIVGHVDNATGPAVFYGLGAVRLGDSVEVIREDGIAVRFEIYDVAVYDKDEVPETVYRDTGSAELRLITCGGTFEEGSGYTANVVVFARMTGTA